MPTGSIRFPVFSLASRGLLASCWKVRASPYRPPTFSAHTSKPQYSSIAEAMLGRANKAFKPQEAPKSNPDLAKQLFPSSSPAQDGNIKDIFKNPRPASQSIGGYTKYTNPKNPLRARSPNIKHELQRSSTNTSVASRSSTVFSRASTASTASTSTSLQSVLNKRDAFTAAPDMINLASDVYNTKMGQPTSMGVVEFDENDFEDDDDIDLDMEYDLPMSMAAPPKPASQKKAPPPPSYALPQLSRPLQRPASLQPPTSSAQTWSSSPPAHKMTPPGAYARRKREASASLETEQIEELDENPRPAKRRALPWLQKQAELDQVASSLEDEEANAPSASAAVCFKCKKPGHYAKDCKAKGTAWDYTPLPKDRKDKQMPWNTTGSAVAEEKKRFKDKQKSRKVDDASQQALDQHNKSKVQPVLAPITLSEEQQRVLDLVVNQSKSVFFTGSAGTGKSVLMRAIIADLKKKYVREGDRVAVTASTGLAACNIGGVTLHSYGGIGLGKEDVPTLVKKIKRNPKAKNRWIRTKILIIDEISMVDGDLFDKLEGIARALRNNGRPFGGIQLVITGDFFQLPPVPDYDNKSRGVKFAFDAGTWSTAIHHTIGLTEVFRQKDPVFANMLNEMRLGKITEDTVAAFRKLSRKINYQDSLDATELFPTRNEVENSNAFRMRDLKGKSYRYMAVDTGTIQDMAMRDKLLANMMAPKQLELKKGAQVMLIKNMDDGLVNGSLGKVIAFMSEKTFEIYDNNPGAFDEDVPDDHLDDADKAVRSKLRTFSASNPNSGPSQEFPLVRFAIADGTTRDLLVQPEEWKVELPNGEVQAQRSQLPLILAWALSIHKAQGQTLERVKIDLKKIFEKGQAYVALSRATSQAGLEVQNFDKTKVMAHPRVAQFYNSLYSVNKALEHPTVVASKPNPNPKHENPIKSHTNAVPSKKAKVMSNGHARAKVTAYEFDDDEEEAMMSALG